ncbi:SHOCT domain-containing protein [Alteribacter natronophilus]|uniref:SHOCT domain-containing protein n=1 Tax=Alteribacter natronophilus TaxID=2583810 RepID=UPI00110DA587|nr:SHOCT domain-containing protein [Alteribacter natronophilus]TMW71161.1 SHOCT domain-containing protein [Alteribacter natronophilus]
MGNIGCLGVAIVFAVLTFSISPWLSLIIFGVAIAGVVFETKEEKRIEESETSNRINRTQGINKVERETDFQASLTFEGNPHVSQVIAVDEKGMKVALIDGERFNESYQVVDYRDILSSEVLVDGKELISTSRSSQIGGALLGGILAGGVGAIIGGLSGTKSKGKDISRIDFHIIINDTANPAFLLNFYDKNNSKSGMALPENLLKAELDSANQIHQVVSVLIHQADKIDQQEQNSNEKFQINDIQSTDNSTSLIADEIRKLSQLKEEGVLTEEEYEKQKLKLLA